MYNVYRVRDARATALIRLELIASGGSTHLPRTCDPISMYNFCYPSTLILKDISLRKGL